MAPLIESAGVAFDELEAGAVESMSAKRTAASAPVPSPSRNTGLVAASVPSAANFAIAAAIICASGLLVRLACADHAPVVRLTLLSAATP